MKIGIDVRCLGEGRRTGVEEYTLNLLDALFKLDRKNDYVLFFNSWRAPRTDLAWTAKYRNVTVRQFRFPNKLLNFLFWYFHWPKIDKMIGGVDLFFMPNIIFGSVRAKAKLFITIHDLSFERYPETFSLKRRLWHVFINPEAMCRRAERIIAVSQSTKNDLADLYEIDKEKIKVIHSGVPEKFKVINRNDEKLIQVKEKYGLPYKFILYLGTIEPRKNIAGVIRAFTLLQETATNNSDLKGMTDYKLVIAGSKGWLSQKVYCAIEKSGWKNSIIVINFVDDSDKEYVYNLASLFVYPSFFEGFGFPILEAMRCGVPVVTSNNSSLPEIARDAAIMIDPGKPQEIADAMREILTNGELRSKLIERGLVHSKEFRWQKTAKKTLDIFTRAK